MHKAYAASSNIKTVDKLERLTKVKQVLPQYIYYPNQIIKTFGILSLFALITFFIRLYESELTDGGFLPKVVFKSGSKI